MTTPRLPLVLIALLTVLVQVAAQSTPLTISGLVIDYRNAEPLAYATVAVAGTTVGTATDADGRFAVTLPDAGAEQAVTLEISAIGYATQTVEAFAKTSGTDPLRIRLEPREAQFQTVEITGRRETGYRNTESFSGTKTATALRDIPQSIGYVTKELALDQAAFRVNDVVRNVSGVNQFSFYNDITIRGFRVAGGNTSGNLVNGLRAYTSFWRQQLIPNLERVEIIKGPASALFGNASPGGTINRVTKKPLREVRRSITTTVGTFETFRTLADFTGPMSADGKLLYRLNLGYENSGSFRDLQFNKNLIVAPSFSYLASASTQFNVDLVYTDAKGRLDRGQAVFGNGDLYSVPVSKSLNAANDYLDEQSINATLSLRQQLAPGLSFNSSFLYSSYDEDLQEHRTANTYAALGDGTRSATDVEMRVFIRRREFFNANFNNYLNYDVTTGPLEHRVLLGYDYFEQQGLPGGSQLQARGYLTADRTGAINSFNAARKERYALDKDGNPVPNVPHFDLADPTANRIRDLSKYIYTTDLYPEYKLRSHGVYVQDQITYGPVQLLLGLRRDYYADLLDYRRESETEVPQETWLPRVGAVVTLSPKLNLYGTYVEGYQPQAAASLNDPNAGGPFDPLTSDLVEFGAKSTLLEGRLSLTAAVYQLRETGSLYSANDAERPDLLVQTGAEQSRGFEVDAIGRLASNWSLVASYAYLDAEITDGGDTELLGRQKPNAPRHSANLWTKYSLAGGQLKGLGFGFGAQYVDERFGSLVADQANPPLFPSYALLDGAVYYAAERFQLQANVSNLLNRTHWVGGYDYLRAFPGAPRTVTTTLSLIF